MSLVFLGCIIVVPFLTVFVTFVQNGWRPFVRTLHEPEFQHACLLTFALSLVAVPVNAFFGTVAAMVLSRPHVPLRNVILALLDLPFAVSPVIVGLAFVLLYGRGGLLAPLLERFGLHVVFAFPGMLLATMFVTIPFVVKEVLPMLEGEDAYDEQAALTLGGTNPVVFWRVTLPNIRWGLLYGIILSNARAMGEFGAVSVLSGNIVGHTQTLTLYVETAYKEYNAEAAFVAAVLLAILSLITLYLKGKIEDAVAEEGAEH